MGLQGMAEIASQMFTETINLTISLDDGFGFNKTFTVNDENKDILQLVEVIKYNYT